VAVFGGKEGRREDSVDSDGSVITRRGARVGRGGGWSVKLAEEGYEGTGEGDTPREFGIASTETLLR